MSFEKVTIGNATLYCGDCFEILPTLNNGEIDQVVSDPPYGVTNHSWDQAPPFERMWQLFESKSKENANYVLFGCGGFTIDLINSKRAWYRYGLTWVKNNKTNWLNSGLMVHRNTEDIMIYGKPGHQKTAVFNVPEGYPHPCSALAFDHDRGNGQQGRNFHVTQKPLHLMGYLLMLYSNPENLVLDCFMGSGTTGCAALYLNRNFVGIEREKKYFDIACRRLEEIHQRKSARYKPRIDPPDDPNELVAEAEEQLVPVITEEQQNLVQEKGVI